MDFVLFVKASVFVRDAAEMILLFVSRASTFLWVATCHVLKKISSWKLRTMKMTRKNKLNQLEKKEGQKKFVEGP